MHTADLHAKYRLFLSDLMKLEFSEQIFKKYPNIKFHENPCSGSRVVPCGWTDGWADMMKLMVAFCNLANAPKNSTC
jgi:hypothetical protein